MAFESKKDKISQVLKENITEIPTFKNTGNRKAGRPAGKTKHPYQFTLKPDNRTKLDKIVKQAGYTSASAFLDDWIDDYSIEGDGF